MKTSYTDNKKICVRYLSKISNISNTKNYNITHEDTGNISVNTLPKCTYNLQPIDFTHIRTRKSM